MKMNENNLSAVKAVKTIMTVNMYAVIF